MALNPTKTASNPRIAKLIELEVSGRIKPEHQQELDTYRAQGQAPAKPGSDLTENQSKSTGFYNRALGSNADFEATSSATQPMGVVGQSLYNTLPETLTNSFLSDDRQKANQAKEDFIRASLRYESGAAISPTEFEGQEKIFFPQAGDGESVIRQKAEARRRVIESLKVTAGEGVSQLDRGDLRFNDQAPAQVANPVNLTAEQEAEFRRLAQSGDPQALARYAASLNLSIPQEQLDAGAKFYADPAKRGISPEVRVDNTIKPVDPGDGAVGAAARGAGDALTLGFLDEVGALADTVQGGGTYNDALNRRRGMAAFDEQNSPYARLGGQLVGGAALPSFGASGIRQLATLGAGYGGAYGFGSSDGGVGSRLAGGVGGGLAGGAAGGALGWLGNAAATRLGNRTPPTGGGADLLAAAERQGVDVLPADVGGPMTRRFTSAAAQGPLSAGPIIRGGQRAAEQMQGARDRIAASVGNAVDPVEAGEAVTNAARGFAGRTSARGAGLYDEAAQLAGDVRVAPERARQALTEQIARMEQVPGGGAGLEQARGLLRNLEGDFTVQGIRDMRTEMFVQPELRGTPASARLRQVVDAAADDVATSLEQQGRGDAAEAFRRADRYWRQRIETIDQTIEPIIGSASSPKSGEQVVQSLMTAGRTNGARLQRFVQSLPAEEQSTLRATVIAQLGRGSAGTQNAEGTAFSANQFLTHWNQLTPRAKDVLFRGEARDALNDLARVAEGTRAAQGYANRSNTAGATFGNIGGWIGVGSVAPTTAALGAVGQMVSGRLLASPRFARWLARPARSSQDLANQVRRLGTIASREPAIANDILPIQQALQQALPQVAAEEQPQQRRR